MSILGQTHWKHRNAKNHNRDGKTIHVIEQADLAMAIQQEWVKKLYYASRQKLRVYYGKSHFAELNWQRRQDWKWWQKAGVQQQLW